MPNSANDSELRRARWRSVKEIFHSLTAVPPAARAARLEELSGGDADLRADVERLLAHHEATGSFLEDPAWRPADECPSFAPGTVLDDRFEIVRRLGAGGMGDVYLARDRALGEEVALKAVSPSLARDSQMLQRLKQEILLARRVSHPNVCRVFDLENSVAAGRECLFFTMEFVPGESLSAYLKQRGPLPLTEAAALAEQIAAGLAAAHEARVLHRDLKPANIMLQMDGDRVIRAVLTDFGVATSTRPEGDARLTNTGEAPGTLAYMAPELLAGMAASPATDIYALGLILLEMRTGSSVLRPDGSGSGIDRLEPRWRAVILRCLEADPGRRYISATQAGKAFAALRRPRRSGWLLSLPFLIGSAIALWGLWPRYPLAAMMITPVQNLTQDAQLDGITEILRQQLNQSAVLNLWNPVRLPAVLAEMRQSARMPIEPVVWREVALRENAPLLVFSNLTKLGEGYVLSLRVEEAGTNPAQPKREWDHTERAAAKAQLFDAVREASVWIRKLSGETQSELSSHDRQPRDVTTSSWDALALFYQAEQLKESGDSDKAVVLLNEAIRIDPEFAMAHTRLGDILTSLHRDREALEQWAAAIEESGRQRLGKREEYRIRAVYGLDSGDLTATEAPLLLWLQEYPRDYLPAYYLGYVYRMQGNLDESLRLLQVAGARHGDEYFVASSLAQTYLAKGAYRQVLEACRRLRKARHEEAADQFEGAARLLDGETAEAAGMFTRMTTAGDLSSRSRGYLLLARAQAETGHLKEALQTLAAGIDFDRNANRPADRAVKLLALAHLRSGEPAEARGYALEATRAYRSPEICMQAGVTLARIGFAELASAQADCLSGMDRFPRFHAMQLRLQGEINLAHRDWPAAVHSLEEAAALNAPLDSSAYLARALALSGDVARARMLYTDLLQRPGILWQNATTALPGEQREMQDESRRLH